MSDATNEQRDSVPWAAIVFTAIYLVIGLVAALGRANWEFAFYIPIELGLGLLVLSIRRRAGLSNGLLMALSVWGLLHVFGGVAQVPEGWPIDGDIPSFYSWEIIPGYLGYDKPVHAFGFGPMQSSLTVASSRLLNWNERCALAPCCYPACASPSCWRKPGKRRLGIIRMACRGT